MEQPQAYKIILINNQSRFQKELKLQLEKELDYKVITETNNWKEFVMQSTIQKSDIIHMEIIIPETNKIDAGKVVTDCFIKRLSKYNGKHVCLKVR